MDVKNVEGEKAVSNSIQISQTIQASYQISSESYTGESDDEEQIEDAVIAKIFPSNGFKSKSLMLAKRKISYKDMAQLRPKSLTRRISSFMNLGKEKPVV